MSDMFERRHTLGHNEQGFVQAGHCCLSSPELKPNKEIKVQVNNQMHNRIPSSPNQSTAMQTAEV